MTRSNWTSSRKRRVRHQARMNQHALKWIQRKFQEGRSVQHCRWVDQFRDFPAEAHDDPYTFRNAFRDVLQVWRPPVYTKTEASHSDVGISVGGV